MSHMYVSPLRGTSVSQFTRRTMQLNWLSLCSMRCMKSVKSIS
jgi:hypothetical protein